MARAVTRRFPANIGGLALGVGLVAISGCGFDLTDDADIPLNTTAQVGSPPPEVSPPPTPPRTPAPPSSLGLAAARSFALSGLSALADASDHPGITAGPIIGGSMDPTRLSGDVDPTVIAAQPRDLTEPEEHVPFGQGDAELPPVASPDQPSSNLPDVESIVGYPEEELRRLLGEPSLIEERPPAFTWQYASETCTLDLTFFLEVGTNTYRVLSYDLKTSREDTSDVDRRCLTELLRSASPS